MWYWIGVVFVVFLLVFEIFRGSNLSNLPEEDIRIASLITLRNSLQRHISKTEGITAGVRPPSTLGDSIPKNIKIPSDHMMSISCILDDLESTQVACKTEGSFLYTVTYVPVELKTVQDRKELLKQISEKTKRSWNMGLWKRNGEIETFHGIREKTPPSFTILRLSLPDDVIVIFDRESFPKAPPNAPENIPPSELEENQV